MREDIRRLLSKLALPMLLVCLATCSARAHNATKATNSTGKLLQARISLESRSLDLEEEIRSGAISNYFNAANLTHKFPSLTITRKRKQGRSDRPLSSIWSMFMSGGGNGDSSSSSNADSDTANADDYEDSVEPSGSAGAVGSSASLDAGDPLAGRMAGDSSTSASSGQTIDQHEERLVAKLARPQRQEAQMGSNEILASTTASSANQSDQQSVQPLTGPVSTANGANDISTLMSSMSFARVNETTPANGDGVAVADTQADRSTRSNKTSDESASNSFERWLSRMQLHDNAAATNQITTEAPSAGRSSAQAANASLPVDRQQLQTDRPATNASTLEIAQMAEALEDVRMRQQQQRQQQLLHQRPSTRLRLPATSGAKLSERQADWRWPSVQRMPAKTDELKASKSQHPFQQHLRQQQAQLIHGIKHPNAQASTISVSTQEGASNTSLSFANSLSTAGAPMVEVSPVVNASQLSVPGEQQVNVFQSQDEILRQVTSAINFEQQELGGARVANHNHRQAGEAATPASLTGQPNEPTNAIANLFRPNDSTDQPGVTSSDSPVVVVNNSANSTARLSGADDIDRSFDFLADKLRLLAQQQQQQQQQSRAQTGPAQVDQPSWLRPKLDQTDPLVANLTKLAASLASGATGGATLDGVRELLAKHERNKNELRSSQETMANLMRQLSQADVQHNNQSAGLDKQHTHQIQQRQNHHRQPHQQQQQQQQQPQRQQQQHRQQQPPVQPDKPAPEREGEMKVNDQSLGGQQVDGGQANPGWTPMQRPPPMLGQLNPPASPANLLKGRAKQTQLTIPAQLQLGGEMVGEDELYMNDLALMLAQSQPGDEPTDQAQPHNQRIIGLPIAILKEEEDFDQLALSANPNLNQNERQNNRLASRLANSDSTRQPDQLGQIQKMLENYSPQTFAANSARAQPPVSLSNLASLLHENNMDPQQDNNQRPAMQLNQASASLSGQQARPAEIGSGSNEVAASPEQPTGHSRHNGLQQVEQNQAHQLQHQHQRHPNQHQHQHQKQPHASNEDFRLHRQQQQPPMPLQQQSQPLHPHAHHLLPLQALHQNPYAPEYPIAQAIGRVPILAGGGAGNAPQVYPGVPVRLREMSLYKPFGMQSHHAFTYQASPTVAAMFPALGQSARPSLLRHMTPFRAGIHESQRLLSPLMPSQLAQSLRQHLPMKGKYQHPTGSMLDHLGFPLPPQMRGPYLRMGNEIKRRSPQHHHQANWPPKSFASPTKLRVHHIEPEELGNQEALVNLDDANELEAINPEEFKYVQTADSEFLESMAGKELHQLAHPTGEPEKLVVAKGSRFPPRVFRQQRSRTTINSPAVKMLVDQPSSRACVRPIERPTLPKVSLVGPATSTRKPELTTDSANSTSPPEISTTSSSTTNATTTSSRVSSDVF